MWSRHPGHSCEQYAQWNSVCSEVWVEGAMRTHAVNRRPSDGTPPSVSRDTGREGGRGRGRGGGGD